VPVKTNASEKLLSFMPLLCTPLVALFLLVKGKPHETFLILPWIIFGVVFRLVWVRLSPHIESWVVFNRAVGIYSVLITLVTCLGLFVFAGLAVHIYHWLFAP
jgi:hypothetical protein